MAEYPLPVPSHYTHTKGRAPDMATRSTTKPLILTMKDIAIFRSLWMLRALKIDQIRRLHYFNKEKGTLTNEDNVRKRLARLARDEYLESDTLVASKQRVYFLADKGLKSLRQHAGIEQHRLYRPSLDAFSQFHHPLLVSECATRIVECLRGTPLSLQAMAPLGIEFYHTHAVENPQSRKHVKRFVTQEDVFVLDRVKPLRIRPDLTFGIGDINTSRLFFLEADRGFESSNDILEKQLGYHHFSHYHRPGDHDPLCWKRYGPFNDYRVLFITTTSRRIESLQKMLSKHDGFNIIAFTTENELKEKHLLFDPIWRINNNPSQPLLRHQVKENMEARA